MSSKMFLEQEQANHRFNYTEPSGKAYVFQSYISTSYHMFHDYTDCIHKYYKV